MSLKTSYHCLIGLKRFSNIASCSLVLDGKYICWFVQNTSAHHRSVAGKTISADQKEFFQSLALKLARWVSQARTAQAGISIEHVNTIIPCIIRSSIMALMPSPLLNSGVNGVNIRVWHCQYQKRCYSICKQAFLLGRAFW